MIDWFNHHYTNRARINLDGALVTQTQEGFVLLVDLSLLSSNFWSVVDSSLKDIRFTTSDGVTQIPFELVRYDYVANTGTIYIRTPELDDSLANIYFYLYYGNSVANTYPATHKYGSQAVWKGNGFEAVYHFTEVPLQGTEIKDATENARHGHVINGDILAVSSSQVGGGFEFEQNEYAYIETVDFDLHGTDLNISVTALVQPANSNGTIVSHSDNGNSVPFHLNVTGSGSLSTQGFGWNTSGWKMANLGAHDLQNLPSWGYVAGTLESNSSSMQAKYYGNRTGASQANYAASNPVQDSPNPMTIGAYITGSDYYVGNIDEVRIASALRDSTWITLEYTMFRNTSSLYTFDLYEVYTAPEIIPLRHSSGACNICLDVKMPDENFWRPVDLREVPKLGFVYAIADIEKTNKPQSFYSTQIELPDTKNNAEVLKHANLVNHSKSLIGVELDCRLIINGVTLDSASGKFILTSVTLDEHKKNVIYKGRLIGSRYLWMNQIKDIKFCEGRYFLDDITVTKDDVPVSWDTLQWGWPKGYLMVPYNYGRWKQLTKVTYQDIRPSTYVRYLLQKAIELTGYTLTSNFFNTEMFSRLILPYVREDYGVPKEYADNNEFLASIPYTKQFMWFPISTDPQNDYVDVGGNQILLEKASLTTESYTNADNKYIANFDSGFNFASNIYKVPDSADKYGGLSIKPLVSYTLGWVLGDETDLVGAEYDGHIQPNNRRVILGTNIMEDTGGWYPTRYTQNMGRVVVELIHEEYATAHQNVLAKKTHVMELGNLSDTDETASSKWSGVFDVPEQCFGKKDQLYIRITAYRDKTVALFQKPTPWADHKLKKLEEANPGGEFQHIQPRLLASAIVVDDMNFGCEISQDLCGDFNTNIADLVHCDLTVKKLIDSLTHMFNLVWQTDPIRKEIFVEPDPTFYYVNGVNEDWEQFIDKGKKIELKPNQSNTLTCERLVYKTDSVDNFVEGLQDKNSVRYLGQDTCPEGTGAYSVSYKENPLFAPTHYILDKILMSQANTVNTQYLPPAFPRLWKEYEPTKHFLEERTHAFAPRILYYDGLKSYSQTQGTVTYKTSKWVYEDTEYETFPHAFMVNPYDTENAVNLSFTKNTYRHVRGDLSILSGYDFNKSIYETYWEDFQERQLLNTTMTAYLKLGLQDIKDLDFRKPKHMLNARWLLSSVKEWNPCLKTAKVRFVLAEKINRDYLTGSGLQENLESYVTLGAVNDNKFIEQSNARFADWSTGAYQVAGEIRNYVSGDIQGITDNTTITFTFGYAATIDIFTWDYSKTLDFTVDDPKTLPAATAFSTDYRPYITGGVDGAGKIYFLFDKKAWAIAKGYSETIIAANTQDYGSPFTQDGVNGPAVDLVVTAQTTYHAATSPAAELTMKPFIFPKTFNNFHVSVKQPVPVISAYEISMEAKDRFDRNTYVDFDSVSFAQYWTRLFTAPSPTAGATYINPVSEVADGTDTGIGNIYVAGYHAETDTTNLAYPTQFTYKPITVEVATHTDPLSFPSTEYVLVNMQFYEDLHPVFDSVDNCWKPTGAFVYSFTKHADSDGEMYELEPESVSYGVVIPDLTGLGVSASNTYTGSLNPPTGFYGKEDLTTEIQGRLTINEPGLHTKTIEVTWEDQTGVNANSIQTTSRFIQTYERY